MNIVFLSQLQASVSAAVGMSCCDLSDDVTWSSSVNPDHHHIFFCCHGEKGNFMHRQITNQGGSARCPRRSMCYRGIVAKALVVVAWTLRLLCVRSIGATLELRGLGWFYWNTYLLYPLNLSGAPLDLCVFCCSPTQGLGTPAALLGPMAARLLSSAHAEGHGEPFREPSHFRAATKTGDAAGSETCDRTVINLDQDPVAGNLVRMPPRTAVVRLPCT